MASPDEEASVPNVAVEAPADSTAPAAAAIPTGFPEPRELTPEPPGMPPARPGYINLATLPPVGELTIPPLDAGGAVVTITADGTEVDDVTAGRAREAAHLAGFTLREL